MSTRTGTLDPTVVERVIDRARDHERYERWCEQVARTGYCTRPVRLKGQVTESDGATGLITTQFTTKTEPDGVLLKACGNRRAAVCPQCSAIYKADSWQLVAAGLKGGKGVPETIARHPAVFATFTAPSFGSVHTPPSAADRRGLCRPRAADEQCAHARPAGCWQRHDPGDPALGDPICPDCFDYEGAVIWNAVAPELWRRTTIYIRRALARAARITQKQLASQVRVSYTKVAEYQRRGLIHFHAVIRLDRAEDQFAPPPAEFTVALLEEAIRTASREVAAVHPLAGAPIRWGQQIHVRRIDRDRETTPEAAAAYLAKYATKSAEDLGPGHGAQTREHIAQLEDTARRLAETSEISHRWNAAESIGFHGHWSTRSRRYSTTLTALRTARADHAKAAACKAQDPGVQTEAVWRYVGLGYTTAADAWLAATARTAHLEERAAAKLETRASTKDTG